MTQGTQRQENKGHMDTKMTKKTETRNRHNTVQTMTASLWKLCPPFATIPYEKRFEMVL